LTSPAKPWCHGSRSALPDDRTGEPSKEAHVSVAPALLPHTSPRADRLNCSSGYKLNFNAIWVLYVEGVIVVAAVGERVPFVVETGNVVV
jgi:hypothetical protein